MNLLTSFIHEFSGYFRSEPKFTAPQSKSDVLIFWLNKANRLRELAIHDHNLPAKLKADRLVNNISRRLNELHTQNFLS